MKKSKKKLFIILGIILVVVILLGILGIRACSAIHSEATDTGLAEFQILEKQELSSSISASGVVESQEIVSVTSDLTCKIKELPVQLGDSVTKGQILCVFDDTELKENIRELEASLSEAQRLSAKQAEINQRTLNEALASREEALAEANAAVTSAQASYNQAKTAYESLGAEAYEEYVSAQNALTAAENARKQTERSTAAEVQSAQDAIDTQTVSGSTDETGKQLAELYRKAEKTTVTAEQDGIITSLNVKNGSIHTGGELMVIQNPSKLKVTVSLTENNILSVKEGMSADISSNALKDTILSGTVSKVINFATTGVSTEEGSTAAGYFAEVIIDEPGQLLLGMNVNVSLITERLEKSLAVAYDSILFEDESEESADDSSEEAREGYVFRANEQEDGTFLVEKIAVTTGVEQEYYTQIFSDELAEGDYILYYPEMYKEGDTVSLDPDFFE